MYTTISSLAVLGLVSSVNAHMIISSPVPYNQAAITNSPLVADGSDFPCKFTGDVNATYAWPEGTAYNALTLGGTHDLSFIGSATHGGGSCQISVTYDMNPTTDSVFKVIHSIEGGCPVKGEAGNLEGGASTVDPDTYSFPIPSDLPSGNAVVAWTWFNKVGNREMYMNCAPVTFSSSSSKRSDIEERDTSAYDALPDMFVANIGNGCGTVDSTDLLFPQPGDSVEQDGTATSSALSTPTGSCQAVSAGASATPGSSVAASSAAGSSVAATSVAASTAAATSAAANTSVPGGVFITVGSSATVAATSVAVSSAAATSVAIAPSAAATSAAASSAAVSPVGASSVSSAASSSSTGSAGSQTAGAACTDEGEFNCVDGTSYQQCGSGVWSVVMPLAAGTSCTPGLSSDLNIEATNVKRNLRFSRAHARRRLHSF